MQGVGELGAGGEGRDAGTPQKGAVHVWGLVGGQLFYLGPPRLLLLESLAESEANTEHQRVVFLEHLDPAVPEGQH